jgi:membrane protein implicated in regulation of membrane protease activity
VKLGGNLAWILLIAWPTIPLLMSAEAGGGAGSQILAFLISALANTLLYAIVGVIVAVVYRRFFRESQSLNE